MKGSNDAATRTHLDAPWTTYYKLVCRRQLCCTLREPNMNSWKRKREREIREFEDSKSEIFTRTVVKARARSHGRHAPKARRHQLTCSVPRFDHNHDHHLQISTFTNNLPQTVKRFTNFVRIRSFRKSLRIGLAWRLRDGLGTS